MLLFVCFPSGARINQFVIAARFHGDKFNFSEGEMLRYVSRAPAHQPAPT